VSPKKLSPKKVSFFKKTTKLSRKNLSPHENVAQKIVVFQNVAYSKTSLLKKCRNGRQNGRQNGGGCKNVNFHFIGRNRKFVEKNVKNRTTHNLTRGKLHSLITYCQDHSHHQDLFLSVKIGVARILTSKKPEVNKSGQGTDVMIFKIFSPKKLAKKWRF
jgi:hypothetical protein